MAEKKTTKKKATKQANPKAVDMVSPVTPADETGLELTETMVQELVVGDDVIDPNEPVVDYHEDKNITPKKSVVEEEECEKTVTDDPDAEACQPEKNQEIETPEPLFKEDKVMVNDITNILNGLDGVKASKIGEEPSEEEEKRAAEKTKHNVNTEEKNYYSEQFSRAWGGVMYDY